jgi:hypothetical protein
VLNDECVWEGFSIHDTQLRLKWNRWGSSRVENELVSSSAHIIQHCLIKWALLTSIAMCRTRTHAKYLPFYVRPNVSQNIKLIINPKFGLRLAVLKLPSCTAALCDVITCSSQLCGCRRVLAMMRASCTLHFLQAEVPNPVEYLWSLTLLQVFLWLDRLVVNRKVVEYKMNWSGGKHLPQGENDIAIGKPGSHLKLWVL